jgi:5-methylcytosine-specific restriction endonuclease McrA
MSEYGYCQCGCGTQTNISKWTDKRYGSIKGEPRRFVSGHATRRNLRADGLKLCIRCNLELSVTQFYPEKGKVNGLASLCKICSKSSVQGWCSNNRERRRAIVKRYDDVNRDRRRVIAARARANKPWLYAKYARDYYARKMGAKGSCTEEQLLARLEMFGGLCYLCGKAGKEVDHVIPLNKGGSDWPANLRPACRSCNAKKSDKDWRPYIYKTTRHLAGRSALL